MSEQQRHRADHRFQVSVAAGIISLMGAPAVNIKPDMAFENYARPFKHFVELGLSRLVQFDHSIEKKLKDDLRLIHYRGVGTTTVPSSTTIPTTTITTAMTEAQRAASEVSAAVYLEWKKVNICEQGGNWHVEGDEFSGGLGISNVNWKNYGGLTYAPNGGEATPDEQILIAQKIQSDPPDQNGCDGSW